jgi:hypothetical protein
MKIKNYIKLLSFTLHGHKIWSHMSQTRLEFGGITEQGAKRGSNGRLEKTK